MSPSDARRRGRRRSTISLSCAVEVLEVRALLSAGPSSSGSDISAPEVPGFKAVGLDVTAPAGIDADLTVASYATSGSIGVASATIDWGDGSKPTQGTIHDEGLANPVFDAGTISGQHSYAKPGKYTVAVTITEDGQAGDGKTVTVTSTATVADATPVPGAPITLTEAAGFAFTADRVATFTVGLPAVSADEYTAKIDWGDHTNASAGQIEPAGWPFAGPPIVANAAGSSAPNADPALFVPFLGQFDVNGGHTYAAAGSYTVTVTISDSAGHSAVVTATANVVSGPLVASGNPGPISSVAGWSLPDYTSLSTFTDYRFNGPTAPDSASYMATIDWGDGTSATPGTIGPLFFAVPAVKSGAVAMSPDGFFSPDQPNHPSFDVTGAHAYAKPGTYVVTVTITDENGDTTSATDTVDVAASSLTAQGVPVSAFPGQAFDEATVATFRDAAGPLPAVAYSATIDWGDGTSATEGTVTGPYWIYAGGPIGINDPPDPGGWLQVLGGHTYAQGGSYTITVTIDGPGGSTVSVTTTADVAPIVATGFDVAATTNVGGTSVPVANFKVPGPGANASDYTATIDWGDGRTSAGSISADGWIVVDPPAPTPAGTVELESAGTTGKGGVPTTDASASFTVSGKHVYTAAGKYAIHVTFTDSAGDAATTTSTATVTDEVLKAVPTSLTAVAGDKLAYATVAKFTDSVFGADTGRFKVTIDWGDGTTTVGAAVAIYPPVLFPQDPVIGKTAASQSGASGNGISIFPPPPWSGPTYRVVGSHTYATAGTLPIHVTITKLDGSTVSVDSSATISTPPPTATGIPGKPVVAGVATRGREVATFITHSSAKSSDFTVVIHWGDGSTPTSGTLKLVPPPSKNSGPVKGTTASSKGTSFIVLGTHAFAHPGTYVVQIAITGKKGATTKTTSKVVVIAPPKPHQGVPVKKGHPPVTAGKSGKKH